MRKLFPFLTSQSSFPRGFSLLELLLVITILGTLLLAGALALNPITQLSRADDTRRKQDLQQIKNALDLYYNDHSCYPSSVPFGSEWVEGNTVYMTDVPQDPSCGGDSSTCYRYVTEGSCPQWNVLFAKQAQEQTSATSCPISSMSSCQPQDYSSFWSCQLLGSVDCAYLQAYSLSSPPDEGGGDTTPTPTTTPSLTPTPTESCAPEDKNYACSGAPLRCNVVPQGTGTYCTSACGGAC